jgi:hypothetical protein
MLPTRDDKGPKEKFNLGDLCGLSEQGERARNKNLSSHKDAEALRTAKNLLKRSTKIFGVYLLLEAGLA